MTVWKFPRRDAAQPAERLDRAVPAARQPTHLLVKRPGAVDADRHHQTANAPLQRPFHERHGLVAEPAGRRKIQQKQRLAAVLDCRDEIVEIAAHEQLAARQVHPSELRPPLEEQPDLIGRHLVHALLLPDVAHLAAEVAVIGCDERHLVRQRRRTQVGARGSHRQGRALVRASSTDCPCTLRGCSGSAAVSDSMRQVLKRLVEAGFLAMLEQVLQNADNPPRPHRILRTVEHEKPENPIDVKHLRAEPLGVRDRLREVLVGAESEEVLVG